MAILDILKKRKNISNNKTDTTAKKSTAKKNVKKDESRDPASLRIDASNEGGERLASYIIKPRITEKASFITEDGAYSFNVMPRANKVIIKKAIEEIYGVKPVRVNIVHIQSKQVTVRNRTGVKPGGKKAIVYLKKGDRIEFV